MPYSSEMPDIAAPPRAPDAVAVLRLIDRLATAPDPDGFARLACDGILELMPALSVSYNELNPTAGRAHGIVAPDPGPGWYKTFRPILEAHQHDNPLVKHYLATGDTRVVAWGDPEIGTITGTTLDREFYQPNGIYSQVGMALPAPPGIVIGIAVNRGREGFSEADRHLLELLRPHLVHAYQAAQVRTGTAVLGRVLGEYGWAVVLVDSDGRVVRSSPATVASAARYGLDVAEGAQLAAGPLDRIRQVIRAYDPATPAAASAPIPVAGPAGTLAAVVVPSLAGPHVVLLRSQSDLAALRAAGLTERQAEVALRLAAGESSREIAQQLGISLATARKHLESVFTRLGVRHRAAAVARVAALRGRLVDHMPGPDAPAGDEAVAEAARHTSPY
jgi:DNA-binding CsgD family transcriptional regulator